MDFACSHVVCNWRPDGEGVSLVVPDYHNTPTVKVEEAPPPLPPRQRRKPRPSSMTFIPPADHRAPAFIPPPVPPRFDRLEGDNRIKANMNVALLSVGRLVNISRESGMESFQSPVVCGKCSAALSCLSSVQNNVWLCEFCGGENVVDEGVSQVCVGQRVGVRSDDVYLPQQSDDDYQNLEDSLVVFCVDVSGSMSITTEVASGFGSPTYVSRLEGIQDALQKTLSSMLKESPRRRVALVTFTNEVVVYGDGTGTPLTLRDWALVDENHIWQQSSAFSVPHCIAETHLQLKQRIKDLREHGATALGPAALASVAVASRYPGSKVVLCTDGRANIGLGSMDQSRSQPSDSPDFYGQVAQRAVDNGVIISVMTFEGTDCRLADIGRLADATGGQVNTVSIGTVATEIQSASADNVLATGATATLMGPDGVYFPFTEENDHKVTKEIGNVTRGTEITFQFAVKPEFVDAFLQKNTIPFQLQLSFKTRDQQRVTRIITEQRPVTSSNRVLIGRLNTAVLGVHSAQLCGFLTMEGRVEEAQRQLKAQQRLLKLISRLRPIRKEESIYGNWMDTMTTICDDIKPDTPVARSLSDEAAKVVYQMRRASSFSVNNNYFQRNTAEFKQRTTREKEAPTEEK